MSLGLCQILKDGTEQRQLLEGSICAALIEQSCSLLVSVAEIKVWSEGISKK